MTVSSTTSIAPTGRGKGNTPSAAHAGRRRRGQQDFTDFTLDYRNRWSYLGELRARTSDVPCSLLAIGYYKRDDLTVPSALSTPPPRWASVGTH